MPLINRVGGGGADVSGVTATASDVLAPKVIVGADGEPITGALRKKPLTLRKEGNIEHTITANENEVYSEVILQRTYTGTNAIPLGKTLELHYMYHRPRAIHIWTRVQENVFAITAGAGEFILSLDVVYIPNAGDGIYWNVYAVTTLDSDGYVRTHNTIDDNFNEHIDFVYDEANQEVVITLGDGYSWFNYAAGDIRWYAFFASE